VNRRQLCRLGLLATLLPSTAFAAAEGDDFAGTGQLTQGGWLRGRVPAGTRALTLDGKPVGFAADGDFLIAFDRDAGPHAVLTASLADGQQRSNELQVAPRHWEIENIPLGPPPGTPPDEEFLLRRAAEVAQIEVARAIDSHSDGWRQSFIWPAHGRISGRFGAQRIYNGAPAAYHSGVDIAGGAGSPIIAPADGVVILAAEAPFTLEGHLLMVDHGMGLNSAFLHCSQLLVALGDRVRQGQMLARIGMTGRATGPHLHWSMKWHDSRLDPMLFAGAMV
jgi:murein DD-endopeptidase MepM/ murein hydrolase activator NlpD